VRSMVVEGERFEYRFGHQSVVIRNAAGKSVIVDYSYLTGRSWSTIERGQHKRTGDGMVKPGHVMRYIRRHILGIKLSGRPENAL
jgi:hypothetical protein